MKAYQESNRKDNFSFIVDNETYDKILNAQKKQAFFPTKIGKN